MPDRPVYVDETPVSLRAVKPSPPAAARAERVRAAPATPGSPGAPADRQPAAGGVAGEVAGRVLPAATRTAGGGSGRAVASVAVVSLKGGVGRTTVAAGLAGALAERGPGSAVAVDVDPHGDLAERAGVAATCGLRELVAVRAQTRHQVAAMAGRPPGSRLDVIAGEDWNVVSPNEVARVLRSLAALYEAMVVDTAPGLARSRMAAAVGTCTQVVVVTTTAFDAADAAWRTFDWLAEAGVDASRLVTVVVGLPPAVTEAVALPRLLPHLQSRSRAVVGVPWSAALAAGRLRLDCLEPGVAAAFTDLAEVIAGAGPLAAGATGPSRW